MPDKPETLEETQARLARIDQGAAMPPAVSVPIPTVSGSPGTPYGPSAPGVPDPAELGGVGDFGTAPTRPDPYAASTLEPPALAAPIVTTRRPMNIVAIAAGVVALVVVAGVVAYNAFDYSDPSGSGDPGEEPEYSQEWQEFPGISYIDPAEALDQPSYEQVVAQSEALLTDYRDSLTAEFGLVWSQTYDGYNGVESNGYGGDSMLYYYDTGSWQGQVKLDDSAARERVFEIFGELAAANGGDDVLLRNDIYADDDDEAKEQFGATELDAQALWSFFGDFPALADGYLSSEVIDRNIPIDASFTGDYFFDYDESSDTFFVTVYGYAGGLLKEADRAAYEEALVPYNGDYEP